MSYDINDEAVNAATGRFDRLDNDYRRDLEATDEDIAATRERLSQTADLAEAVKNADLVIESVPEKIELKKETWSKVGELAPESALFTTNSSTLLPSSFAAETGRPEKFLAMHFANNIRNFRTSEIMPHEGTAQESTDRIVAYAKEMQMVPIQMKREQPGYVLNSLLVPFLEGAQRLLVRDVADPADIDLDWCTSTGAPSGPCQIMDVVGLRTVTTIGETRAEATGDEELAAFVKLAREEYLDKGKTGVESGEGFFKYDQDGNRIDK